jgi:hypothetical protein
MHIRAVVFPLFILMVTTLGQAQSLPPVSRTVFKCQVAGKTVYSDAPCLGAKQIDVEPTRGLNQTSGNKRIGADVMHEQGREAFAQAVRPITGMDAKQLAVQGRRNKLNSQDQQECRRLDGEVAASQQDEKASAGSDLKTVQEKLFQKRKRFRELGC